MEPYLYKKLVDYKNQNIYPFHMPGHKRNIENEIKNPYEIDITEIDGFDNLNDPNDIIKKSMDEASKFYGTKKTFYLVNGSTVGILSAITAVCKRGDKILMARNCHKAVYNAVRLLELDPIYLPLLYIPKRNMFGSVDEERLRQLLSENPDIKAVVITSPTYEGIVMHIESIKMWIEPYKIPFIVDEAHGAHFPFCDQFPKSAVEKGADLVIQSVHKTMPSFTQTALLHICSDRVSEEVVQDCLSIYQSSSPSYIFMAGIEYAISYGIRHKKEFEQYEKMLRLYREKFSHFRHISLLQKEELQQYGAYDFDPCKLVFFFEDTDWTGNEISSMLLKEYGLQMEMSERDYIIAISSIMDTEEGFERLYYALCQIDEKIEKNQKQPLSIHEITTGIAQNGGNKKYIPSKALQRERLSVPLEDAKGKVCGDYIYIYPPGIPILVPGEEISKEHIQLLMEYKKANFYVKGIMESEVGLEEGIEHSGNKEKSSFEILVLKEDNL